MFDHEHRRMNEPNSRTGPVLPSSLPTNSQPTQIKARPFPPDEAGMYG